MSRDSVQVLVDSARVGTLFRDDKSEGDFLFGYFADTHPELAVSLTMPVRRAQYDSMNEVHPIFEMSLPEGYLRKTLESMFAKALGTFDSMDMLALLGQSQVGRIRYGQAGQSAEDVPEHDLTQLLACRGAEEYFDDLVQRLLDRKFAVGGEVGATPSRPRHDRARTIGQDGIRLGAAGVDADHEGWGLAARHHARGSIYFACARRTSRAPDRCPAAVHRYRR